VITKTLCSLGYNSKDLMVSFDFYGNEKIRSMRKKNYLRVVDLLKINFKCKF
jgi:hypothetical protein